MPLPSVTRATTCATSMAAARACRNFGLDISGSRVWNRMALRPPVRSSAMASRPFLVTSGTSMFWTLAISSAPEARPALMVDASGTTRNRTSSTRASFLPVAPSGASPGGET
ncbi:hypothetical protein D9M69_676640 [compost metagenome]